MLWGLVLVQSVEKQLKKCPSEDQKRILLALAEMRQDPYRGDITYLEGEGGVLRRRVGRWRILFALNAGKRLIVVLGILRRTSSTY